jgi:hypothetical protein
MEASGYDPDSEQGDILNVTWSSDKQGIIHHSTQSLLKAVVNLDPGIHEIELRVEDRSGNVALDRISVVVSLWGWGEMPWSLTFSSGDEKIDIDSPYVELDLQNDSPLILRFNINGDIGSTTMEERNVMVGPRSGSQITILVSNGLEIGERVVMNLSVETETLNGTYGGTQELSATFIVESPSEASDEDNVVIKIITIISIISLLGVAVYLIFTFMIRARSDHKGDY